MIKLVHDICSAYDWIDTYSVDGDIQSVLSHNDEPTLLQATSLASSKERIDLAHHRIEQDIDTLEHALDALRARRHALNRLSVRHAGALSTLRRLPNEILSQIFLYACGDGPLDVTFLDGQGPWRLRTVCRKWASIAEGCSELWCNMVIDVTYRDVNSVDFAHALQFCGSRPIQMQLSLQHIDTPDRWHFLRRGLDTIVSSSQKWDTLSLEIREELFHFVLQMFPLLEQKLPLLRSLKLWAVKYDDINSMSSIATCTALLSAPSLEDVHMELPDSVLFERLLEILPFPYQQIRQLSYNSSRYQPVTRHGPLFILQEKFPLLKKCVLRSCDDSAQSPDPVTASARLQHDRVTHLITSRADVLSAFSFPALRTFALGDPDGRPNRPSFTCESSEMIFERASDMLSASCCSLVSLVLSYTFSLVDEFLPILLIVPTLEILDMRVAWTNGRTRDEVLQKLFTGLRQRNDDSTFAVLPALQDLRLSIAAQSSISYDIMQDGRFYPYDLLHEFCFVSKVYGAIKERTKYPTHFRVFSFTITTDDSSRWLLSAGDAYRLQNLKSTNFISEGPLMDSWDSETEDEDEEE